jgi:hypothetical protein
MVMRKIDEIIIHCTATRPNWWEDKTTEEKVAEVKRWHVQDNGWSDLGYHYLIDRDGTVAKGRPVEKAGAHCKGHNSTTIGVSLFGGHGSSERDTFNEHFTVEKLAPVLTCLGGWLVSLPRQSARKSRRAALCRHQPHR